MSWEPEFLAGEAGRCVQARAKLPFGCAACLFVQITPNQGPQNWKAACRVPLCNPGLTWLCVVQTWREYGGVYSDMFSEKFSSNKQRKLLVKQLQADTLTGWEHASTHISPSWTLLFIPFWHCVLRILLVYRLTFTLESGEDARVINDEAVKQATAVVAVVSTTSLDVF